MKPRDFRAINGLCLVDFNLMELPVSETEALYLLAHWGITPVEQDIVTIARSVLGEPFRRNCSPADAPGYFDCSSLTQWLYGQIGFELPRLPIQQWEVSEPVDLTVARPGDLIFSKGRKRNRYSNDPNQDVGHVGIVTGDNAAIYACWRGGVVETTFRYFTSDGKFRGIHRVADLPHCHILQLPPNRPILSADDIKWLVLDNLRFLPPR